MKIKRIVYLGYYLTKLDVGGFRRFFRHVQKETGLSSPSLMWDVIRSSLKYNISLLEYFQFRFWRLDHDARSEYAGTGYMYEYELVMNPLKNRKVLANKNDFAMAYRPFMKHRSVGIESLRSDPTLVDALLNNPSGKIVLKHSLGQCGWQVHIHETALFRGEDLVEFMERKRCDLAEEFIVQHPALMELSPSGVNTVRIITQLNANDDVEFLGARLRITENSPVDNMAAGNFVAPIDPETGIVNGPGVYSDITKPEVGVHPVTGVPIEGFQIPFWAEILDLTKSAAKHNPRNRSIGWDVAVQVDGPGLIEGNHDWCKLVWQLPVKKGLKPILARHLAQRTGVSALP